MNISNSIQRYFNYQSWTIARHYYESGFVKHILIDYDPVRDVYLINAKVQVYYDVYPVHLELKRSGNFPSFRCACRNSMANRVACAHIGAVMFQLQHVVPTSFPYEFDYEAEHERLMKRRMLKSSLEDTNHLIQDYKSGMEKLLNLPERVQEVSLKGNVDLFENGLCIDFKIGNKKWYVLKNCRQFIENVDKGDYVVYGKELKFEHVLQNFDDQAKETIAFIRKLVYADEESIRSLKVADEYIDDLYDLYVNASERVNVDLAEREKIDLCLEASEEGDLIIFSLEAEAGTILLSREYVYLFADHVLYRCSKLFSDRCRGLLSYFQNNEYMVIDRDHIHDFAKYILSSVGSYIELKKSFFDRYVPQSYTFEVYVDLADNGDVIVNSHALDAQGIKRPLICDEIISANAIAEKAAELIESCAGAVEKESGTVYISDDEMIRRFVEQVIPKLHSLCTVYVSDAIKNIRNPKPVNMQVGVRLSNGLLEIELSSVDIPKEEISEVLRSYKRKKKYYRLKNGDTIDLRSSSIEEVDKLLTDLNVHLTDDSEYTVDHYRLFELDQAEKDFKTVRFERSRQFNELISTIKASEKKEYEIPAELAGILRDYQVSGFKWLKTMQDYHLGGILADDMGLGKTLQVIALLEDNKNKGGHPLSIVVTPASLILNWKDEIKKFSMNLSCLCVQGNKTSRDYLITQASQYDILITSYDYLRNDIDQYAEIIFENVILDEAQYIKNHTTKNARAVKQLKGLNKIALTGTPIENSLAELWSIFDFLMPNYLYNYHYFKSEYERPIVKDRDEKAQEKLKQIVRPFILRRNKKDVLKELPDKIEQNILLEFSDEEKKVYIANLAMINKELQAKLQTESMDKFQVLAMMTRLRQLCCDRRLVYENVEELSSKLEGCLELIRSAMDSGKKILLFSAFTGCLDLIEKELVKEEISYYKLIGSTKKEDRHEMVEKFQTDDTSVFLISLKAGGTGLNLTAAEIVIHFDPWWNMSAQNQATDRAYRIGQVNNVQVFKLIMKDSIEEKIMELQHKKMNLADTFVSGNEGSITSMSAEEIMDLFTIG